MRLPVRKDNSYDGIITSTFNLQPTYSHLPPRNLPMKMIRNGYDNKSKLFVKESWEPIDDNDAYKPILVNEMSDLEQIGSLKNKWAPYHVSIWRPKQVTGYFRIGDLISIGDRHPDIGQSSNMKIGPKILNSDLLQKILVFLYTLHALPGSLFANKILRFTS